MTEEIEDTTNLDEIIKHKRRLSYSWSFRRIDYRRYSAVGVDSVFVPKKRIERRNSKKLKEKRDSQFSLIPNISENDEVNKNMNETDSDKLHCKAKTDNRRDSRESNGNKSTASGSSEGTSGKTKTRTTTSNTQSEDLCVRFFFLHGNQCTYCNI